MALMTATAYENWGVRKLKRLMKDQRIRTPDSKRIKSWYINEPLDRKLDEAYIAEFEERLKKEDDARLQKEKTRLQWEEGKRQQEVERRVQDKDSAVADNIDVEAAPDLDNISQIDGSDGIHKSVRQNVAANRNRDFDAEMLSRKNAAMGFMTEAKYMDKFIFKRLYYYLSYIHELQIVAEDKGDMAELAKYAASLIFSESDVDECLANHEESGMAEFVDDGGYSNEDLEYVAREEFESEYF